MSANRKSLPCLKATSDFHEDLFTMFLFDRSGKTVRVLYGAPPDLHEQAENTLKELIK
jgi:hypothetical protein